jgi:23S rRNA pseudouridine2457 synthase
MSQFSGEGKEDGDKRTLADVCGARVPRDVYPVGRLDFDSEGLLVLTNDPAVNYCLLDPVRGHRREYWVQVEGELGDEVWT